MIIAVSYDIYSDILCIFVAYFFSSEEMCFVIWRSFYYSYFRKSGKFLNEVQDNESKHILYPQSRAQTAFSYLNFGLTRALPINEEEYVYALFCIYSFDYPKGKTPKKLFSKKTVIYIKY